MRVNVQRCREACDLRSAPLSHTTDESVGFRAASVVKTPMVSSSRWPFPVNSEARGLALAPKVEGETHDCPAMSLGIAHVKKALTTEDGAESLEFARWYDETEPYDLSGIDRSQVDPGLPSISGGVDDAYVTSGEDAPRVSRFSIQGAGDCLVLNLEYTYRLSGGSNETPLDIVECYQDGSALRRQSSALSADPRSIGGRTRLLVGIGTSPIWVPGRYAVFVYAGGRKVPEMYYEVTP